MANSYRLLKGESLQGGSATFPYKVWGPTTISDAITYLLTIVSSTITIGTRTFYIREDEITCKHIGLTADKGHSWTLEVPYSEYNEPDTNDTELSFDVGLDQVTIYNSSSTVQTAARAGDTAPDFGGMIGVESDGRGPGRVRGVAVSKPTQSFEVTKMVAAADLTAAYEALVLNLIGDVNSAVFRNYAIGEVRFIGLRGSPRGNKDYELTYRFARSANVASLTVATGITLTNVNGWDYVWLYRGKTVDTANNVIVPYVRAAYVERIFQYSDLNTLGL